MAETKRKNSNISSGSEFSAPPITSISRFYSFWTAHRQHVVLGVLLLMALGAGATGYYFYDKYTSLGENPSLGAQREVDALIAQVARLIVLPEGEQPTIATVSDPERLRDQPFFTKAQIGDKVLIYTNARKAILYSPKTDKIVEVAPINIGNPSPSPASRQ